MSTYYGTALYPVGSGTPNGVVNANVWAYTAAAVVSGSTIQMGQQPGEAIPAFSVLFNCILIVSAATTAAFNVDIGYAATDGDVTTTNATNLTYFASALDVHTAGRYGPESNQTGQPVSLPKDAFPVITTHSATFTGTLTLIVSSFYSGTL